MPHIRNQLCLGEKEPSPTVVFYGLWPIYISSALAAGEQDGITVKMDNLGMNHF